MAGAIAGGAEPAAWRLAGGLLGEAYQVADDLADALGEARRLGKPIHQDGDKRRPSVVTSLGVAGRDPPARRIARPGHAVHSRVPRPRQRRVLPGTGRRAPVPARPAHRVRHETRCPSWEQSENERRADLRACHDILDPRLEELRGRVPHVAQAPARPHRRALCLLPRGRRRRGSGNRRAGRAGAPAPTPGSRLRGPARAGSRGPRLLRPWYKPVAIPQTIPRALLEGFEWDAQKRRYRTARGSRGLLRARGRDRRRDDDPALRRALEGPARARLRSRAGHAAHQHLPRRGRGRARRAHLPAARLAGRGGRRRATVWSPGPRRAPPSPAWSSARSRRGQVLPPRRCAA